MDDPRAIAFREFGASTLSRCVTPSTASSNCLTFDHVVEEKNTYTIQDDREESLGKHHACQLDAALLCRWRNIINDFRHTEFEWYLAFCVTSWERFLQAFGQTDFPASLHHNGLAYCILIVHGTPEVDEPCPCELQADTSDAPRAGWEVRLVLECY